MKKVYSGHSKASGIYQIINKANGKVYIGQAKQLATRAMQHEKALRKQKHSNQHLQAAWNLYGPDAFEFQVLVVIPNVEERNKAEQALITKFYGDGCYNIRKQVITPATTWSHTPEESRRKKSLLMKGNKNNLGKKRSEETKEKLRIKNLGKKLSEEHKKKMSEAKMGKPSPKKGSVHSEASKQKMSDSLKGRTSPRKGVKLSEETKQKLREAHLGKTSPRKGVTLSQEIKNKISESNIGRKLSEETRKKMSESRRRRMEKEEVNQRSLDDKISTSDSE